jgi:DNA-binding transcriptional LysR family regulator
MCPERHGVSKDPSGPVAFRPQGSLMTNSSEVVREAILADIGIGLRSTWDIGPELADGRLVQVLPDYEGSHNIAVHAIYPSRQFLPVKVRLFIDYLADLYGSVPYWDAGLKDAGDAPEEAAPWLSAVR